MKPIDQTIVSTTGNCLQACLASFLELPIEEVPNFRRYGRMMNVRMEDWLELEMGLDVSFAFFDVPRHYLIKPLNTY